MTLHGLTHFGYPKYGKITARSQICHKARFDSGICLPKYLTRSHRNSCVPLLDASVCVLRETAKCDYNFPFLCEAAALKLFRQLGLGHVAYCRGRQSCDASGRVQPWRTPAGAEHTLHIPLRPRVSQGKGLREPAALARSSSYGWTWTGCFPG